DGEEVVYTITEHDVPGYESAIDGLDITNTRADEKSIEITKAWLDDDSADRPDSITVELFRSVEGGEQESVDTYTVTEADDWNLTVEALPSFDENGKAYTYVIEEVSVDGYIATINGFDITNLRTGTTDVSVEKVWKGSVEDSVTINLLANGDK